ncbi:MAG: prepilin-type N-terminal cleavage/methylation domain-containing protein [Thermodesulfobacteriota bacterium]
MTNTWMWSMANRDISRRDAETQRKSLVTRNSSLPLRARITEHGHDQRPRTRITNTNHGFTLLEVMVSLAILATAFAAALRLHSDSMGMLISSRIHTNAAELAQFKMTDIERLGITNMGATEGDFGDMAPDYFWDIQVENTPDPFWKKVTVVVRNRHGGRAGECRLVEYMLQGLRPGPETSR